MCDMSSTIFSFKQTWNSNLATEQPVYKVTDKHDVIIYTEKCYVIELVPSNTAGYTYRCASYVLSSTIWWPVLRLI